MQNKHRNFFFTLRWTNFRGGGGGLPVGPKDQLFPFSKYFSNKNYSIIWSHVYLEMFRHLIFPCEICVALAALERPLPCVRLHVALKMRSCHTIVVALVTFEWLLSCMLPHHVNFQMISCNAGILAYCASVRLFPRVGPLVLLQTAWIKWEVVTLAASMWYFTRVTYFVPL